MAKSYLLYGWHSVVTALKNPNRQYLQLLLTDVAKQRMIDDGLHTLVNPRNVRLCSINDLNKRTNDGVHQGIALEVMPLSQPDLQDILQTSKMFLMLDQVTDPHNFGAIIRTAAAFSADGVIVQSKHCPAEGSIIAKSASGGLEHIPIISVTNLSRSIELLKNNDFWCIAFDSSGNNTFDPKKLGDKKVLMMGAEGKGLRNNLITHADILVRLPTNPDFPSLNVSNAAAIALYACG